ncbi:MAG: ATP-binding protein [Streptosporangiaceae bacterium]
MRSRPVRQHLWLLVTVLCSIMLVITAITLILVRTEDVDITELTAVVGPANDLNASILQTMTNAETGLRGYLATGDPGFLDLYVGAEQQVHTAQSQLGALLASPKISVTDRSHYAQQEAVQDVATANWWRYALQARAEGASVQSASLIAGEAVFDQVRAANVALASALTAQREALSAMSRRTLTNIVFVLLGTTMLAVLVGFAVAGRMSRAVAVPVMRLRQVAQRQREGDTGVRASEDSGPTEIRDLAVAFNVLSAHNTELAAAQAAALQLQQVASDIGRAIRATSSVRQAMDVTCAQVGQALQARRVMVTMVDEVPKITAAAQWHAPDLDDLPGGVYLEPYLNRMAGQIASELWSSGGRVVVDDLLAEDLRREAWAQPFHRDTGATALVVVPIGLGDRAIGVIYVVSDTGRREWTTAEAGTVQQVATFLARAITQAEYEAQRTEYVGRLENLDRQKTEFLSTVSHELRTPLTSIQGYIELLLEGDTGPLADGQRHMLGVIDRNTARLRGLIEDILVLNRIESGGLIPNNSEVSVCELVDHAAEEMRPLAAKSAVRLCVDTDDDGPTVIGDRTQLQRALVNILSNAIKFTPSGGAVQLSCRVDPATQEVVLACQDTGIGIPAADLEHLFTRFFRASNAASKAIPGTGLGLAIVQAIVEVNHGRLTLDSVEGEGTTVTLRLPLTGSTAAPGC